MVVYMVVFYRGKGRDTIYGCVYRGKGRDTKYLVKWCDLNYEDCTWEYPGEVHKAIEDEFQVHIDKYWERR